MAAPRGDGMGPDPSVASGNGRVSNVTEFLSFEFLAPISLFCPTERIHNFSFVKKNS